MEYQPFKHPLGVKATSKVYAMVGTLISRSQSLYGCNRYYLQPAAGGDNKIPDGYWIDEDDIVLRDGEPIVPQAGAAPGGPASRER